MSRYGFLRPGQIRDFTMKHFLTWIKKEVISVLPAVIYFLVVFNVIFYVQGLLQDPATTRYFSHISVTVGALIVGKVMLVANSLPFIHAFPHKPLIYTILWKVFIYDSLIVIVWMADTFFHLDFDYRSDSIAWEALITELSSPVFLSSLIWLLLFFVNFVLISEIIQAVGKDKIRRLLLG